MKEREKGLKERYEAVFKILRRDRTSCIRTGGQSIITTEEFVKGPA